MSENRAVRLFCYGSLLLPDVQQQVFGREMETVPDALLGYAFGHLTIADPTVLAISGEAQHRAAYPQAGSRIDGRVLSLTNAELDLADAYEVDDYERLETELVSGSRAFFYRRRPSA